jgi:hypothetical protein
LAAVVPVGGDSKGGSMSKKNNLAKRKKQYEFDLQRTIPSCIASFPFHVQFRSSPWFGIDIWWCAGEKEAKEKQAKKLQAKKSKMKVLSTPLLSLLLPSTAVLVGCGPQPQLHKDALVWLVNTGGTSISNHLPPLTLVKSKHGRQLQLVNSVIRTRDWGDVSHTPKYKSWSLHDDAVGTFNVMFAPPKE